MKKDSNEMFSEFRRHIFRWPEYIAMTIVAKDETASCRVYIYDEEPDMAIISDLCVDEKQRRKGIATKLISYCIFLAKAEGCDRISLRSDDDDFVRSWYTRLGFELESSQVWLKKEI